MAVNDKFKPRASASAIDGDEVKTPKKSTSKKTKTTEVVDDSVVIDTSITVDDTDEVVESIVKEEPKEEAVTFEADLDSKPIERLVKIKLAKKFKGCIGGQWYHFDKDAIVNVPENVKRILSTEEGMLKPL